MTYPYNVPIKLLEPVLDENNKACWLICIRNKKVSKTDITKPIEEIIKENKTLEEEKIFELKPMGLFKCRNEKYGGCGRTSSFDVITKTINPDLWRLPKWKDISNDEIDMLGLYDDLYKLTKRCLIFIEEIQYKIFILWIISTWKTGIWDTVSFLVFLGLINSGKSRALDFIRETGYRMIHSSGVTFPAMVRATHYYNAGILLDEVQNKLNPHDEKGREYINFIKPSYRKGSKYIVADKEDQEKIISYNNFGFKAFAGEKRFDLGLMDRGIIFEMEQDYPEISNFKEIESDFENIKTRLLNYRYKLNNPETLDNGRLKGRTREIFECIISTGIHIGLEVEDIFNYAKQLEEEKLEEFIDTVEWNILQAIKDYECNVTLGDAPEEMKYSDIISAIKWDGVERAGQKLGYIFKNKLGLKTKRKTEGTVLLLNHPKNLRKLKYLYRRYKI
jgi:hypothetical protein